MNFSTKHQRRLISPLVSSVLRGTTLGLSMTMLVFVPSILAQPDTGNSNNSTSPSVLPGVIPSPSVNPSRPTNNSTLTPLFPPRPTLSEQRNNSLPIPTNDNNSIPGTEINLMEDRMFNLPNNQPNVILGQPENERSPNSTNTNHHSLNNSDESDNGSSRPSFSGQDSNLNNPNSSIDSSSNSRPSSHGQNTNLNNSTDNPATSRNNGGSRN